MKKTGFLICIILNIVFASCERDKDFEISNGLNFSSIEYNKMDGSFKTKEILVSYKEILAYDSAQHVFQLSEQAWELMKSQITPIYPDPNFGFGVAIDDEVIYRARFIPGYYSTSFDDVITFLPFLEKYIHMTYGYPGGHYVGTENINDPRIIELLAKDGKLKTIDL